MDKNEWTFKMISIKLTHMAKKRFLKVLSKQRNFPWNVDIFDDMGKNRFLKVISKQRHFSRNVDKSGDMAKNDF